MRKFYFLILLILLFSVGCSKSSSSNITTYGYVNKDKYINPEFNFSMEVPENWTVNENIEKLNTTALKDMPTIIIGTISSKDDLSRIGVISLSHYTHAQDYANEQFEFEFGNEKLNAKSISKENINGKEFIIVNYNNSKKYITDSNDKILLFETLFSNESKGEIDSAIKSIKFN